MLEAKVEEGWQILDTVCRWKIVRTCEIAVPLNAVNPEPGSKMFSYLTLTRAGEEVGRWPTDAPMLLTYAGPQIEDGTLAYLRAGSETFLPVFSTLCNRKALSLLEV